MVSYIIQVIIMDLEGYSIIHLNQLWLCFFFKFILFFYLIPCMILENRKNKIETSK